MYRELLLNHGPSQPPFGKKGGKHSSLYGEVRLRSFAKRTSKSPRRVGEDFKGIANVAEKMGVLHTL